MSLPESSPLHISEPELDPGRTPRNVPQRRALLARAGGVDRIELTADSIAPPTGGIAAPANSRVSDWISLTSVARDGQSVQPVH